MKKRWIALAILIGGGAGLAVLGLALHALLAAFGLVFRPWMTTAAYVALSLLLFVVLAIGFSMLVTRLGVSLPNGKWNVVNKVFCTAGLMGCVALAVFLFQMSMLLCVFSYQPEHIVTRDGQTQVAVVNSFLHVNVYYHEYKNFLWMGKDIVTAEYYGRGGYDPFTRDPRPTPVE